MKENITFKDLESIILTYNIEELEVIKKAYDYAERLHQGQVRQSGEAYIVHPLSVAYILAGMHADTDTICAGLLHDTLEDTDITKEEIKEAFNETVANLVDGVTKISKMNFSSKQAENLANTRKIITGITEDVRIIIIKLADRLHNMRTLQYKSKFKQKENSVETLDIFVPLAYYIGAYGIKSELEDLSLKYLKPDVYKEIEEEKIKVEEESKDGLEYMLSKIKAMLEDNNIPSEIKMRTKNIYGIYKKKIRNQSINEIHDLLALKILLEEVENCYRSLYYIHKEYHPINEKFKDYICNPKTNMYSSLHTTVFGESDRLVQMQIRTYEMEEVASSGLTAYWKNESNARIKMQEELKTKYQFFESLVEIDSMFSDNQEFVNRVKNEVFSDQVYVYTSKGDIIELPEGATPIDFAYKIHTDIGNTMVGVIVNEEQVNFNYKLQNEDRVKILTDELSFGPEEEWLHLARTSSARRKIREFRRK